MTDDALMHSRTLLNNLLENARKGMIIPRQLPDQLEEILIALDAGMEQRAAASSAAAPDLDTYRQELGALLSHGFHDLRLPLTSIRGYSDMLGNPAMGSLSDMQQQFMGTIKSNVKRMEALLGDVSDISKIWNGTLKASVKMDMFKNIAMMVEKQMKPLATELNRTLEFEIPQGLPILNTDGELLAKALNKLTENALRYINPEVPGVVRVIGMAEGSQLHIQIQDNGIGITAEDMTKIGTPYFRSDHEVVLNYKGSGLGVPIAMGILNLLGGTIQFESQPDQGTVVTVTLSGMS